jgi:hypothetical protein
VKRREFIAGLGSAATAWPSAARSQRDDRVRRVAVLQGDIGTENEPGYRSNLTAFREEMAKLGWIERRNLRLDHRAGAGDLGRRASFNATLPWATPGFTASNLASARQRPNRRITPPIWLSLVEQYRGLSTSIVSPCCEPRLRPPLSRRDGMPLAVRLRSRGRFRRLCTCRK